MKNHGDGTATVNADEKGFVSPAGNFKSRPDALTETQSRQAIVGSNNSMNLESEPNVVHPGRVWVW